MSWSNVIPFWIILTEQEEHEARMMGAFEEELLAGFVRSLPLYVVEKLQRERNLENYEDL